MLLCIKRLLGVGLERRHLISIKVASEILQWQTA